MPLKHTPHVLRKISLDETFIRLTRVYHNMDIIYEFLFVVIP